MNRKTRIAVTEAGKKYIVSHIDFGTQKVHCFGELVSFVNRRTKHAKLKSFDLTEVTIEPVPSPKLDALIDELFEQTRARLIELGEMERDTNLRTGGRLLNPIMKPGATSKL